MKINNWIAVIFFTIVIIAIGRINAKIGFTIAGIVLLSTLIMNTDNVKLILNGGRK